jgi:hypothetical protein
VSCRPEGHAAHILIGAGSYHETVNITRSAPLTLLASIYLFVYTITTLSLSQGQLPLNATLELGKPAPPPLVHIWDDQYIGKEPNLDDAQTAVFLVAPSLNASLIGAGTTGAPLQPLFGNVDFKAYNLAIENRAVSVLERLKVQSDHAVG